MAPISMSNKPKRKRKSAKQNGETTYIPTPADQFPFGAPSSSKTSSSATNVPAGDTRARPHANLAATSYEMRKTQGRSSIDVASSKRQKSTEASSQVTAFASPANKRKVHSAVGTIDPLSVKQSKVLKTDHEWSKKRKSVNYGNIDRVSAKRPKTGSENVDDDLVMDDLPLDEATEATETKSNDKSTTEAKTPRVKRDVPISLESLAREEEAAKAAAPTATSKAEASYPSPANSFCKCIPT